jgi:hypothetical protein
VNHPSWAKPGTVDQYGNVACAACGQVQSPSFKACTQCCKHDVLDIDDDWIGGDDNGHWGIMFSCRDCGMNYGFDRRTLQENYEVVRKDRQ